MSQTNKIYHLCFQENKVPGPLFSHHNDMLLKEGAIASLKFRRGPLVDKKDIYLVFWHEEEKTFFSRINTALYGLDWMFFKDGHEMVEIFLFISGFVRYTKITSAVVLTLIFIFVVWRIYKDADFL